METAGVTKLTLSVDELARRISLENVDIKDLKKPSKNEEQVLQSTEGLRSTLKQTFPQLLAAVAALLGGLCFGNVLCFSSVAMPSLRENHENYEGGRPTEEQISWISSIFYLGAVAVCGPTGVAVDWFGRRKVMLYLSFPFVGGWLLIYFARNFEMMLVGRFLTGFFGGAFSVAAPTFIAETAKPNIRSMLINAFELTLCFGCMYILIVGTFLSWRQQALACAFIPLISFFILLIVPESPRYLLSKGKVEEAEKSLMWLRGVDVKSDNYKSKLDANSELKSEFHTLMEEIAHDQKETSGWSSQWKEMKSRVVLKGLLLAFPLFFFQEFCGICALDLYLVEIFQDSGSILDEHLSSIIIVSASTVSELASIAVVERCGKKPLMAISLFIMTIALGSFGAFFYVKGHNPEYALRQLSWLPLVCMSLIVLGYCFGIGPIPYSIMAEVFPQKVRGLGCSILLTSKWTMTFIVGRSFKDFMGAVGQPMGYWSFASVCVVGFFFVIFVIPETTGMTLEEIQKDMRGEKKMKPDSETNHKTKDEIAPTV